MAKTKKKPSPENAKLLAVAIFLRAEAYLKSNEPYRARYDYTEALKLHPRLVPALLGRAQACLKNQDYVNSVKDFQEAIKLEPARETEVLKDYARALRLHGKARYHSSNYDDAINMLSKSRTLHPEEFADEFRLALSGSLNNRGCKLHNDKKHEEAFKDYCAAIELDEKDHLPRTNRAILHRLAGRLEEAMTDCNEALKLKVDYSNAYHQRAWVYIEKKMYPEAIKDLNEALRLNPSNYDQINDRGICYLRSDLNDEAFADFTEYMEKDPQKIWGYTNRAIVFTRRGDHKSAIKDLTQALKVDPKNGDTLSKRAKSYLRDRQFAKAKADYVKWCALTSDDVDSSNMYAWFLATCPRANLRDGAQAIILAHKACEATEWKKAYILDTLAAAYAECGQFDEAISYQEKAIAMYKPAAPEHYKKRLAQYQNHEPSRDVIDD